MTKTKLSAVALALAMALPLSIAAMSPAAAQSEADASETEAPAAQQVDLNSVVANVNGTDITERDLKLAETEIGNDLGQLSPETRRRVLVEYVIETQLMADALDKKQDASPALDSTLAYFKRRAKREVFFENEVKASVSEKAARTFFKDRVKGMKPEEEVKARHILVETEEEARDVKEKIARGADFAEMAKEHSRDPGTKDNGGLLGYFSKGQMVPAFERAAFNGDLNEVSEPVQSRFGWHLILVEDKRQKPLPKFRDVKDRILNGMIHQKAQAIAKDLRNKAEINYLDENIKKQVAEEQKQAEAQQQQFIEQIQKLKKQQDEKAKADPAAAGKTEEPAKQ